MVIQFPKYLENILKAYLKQTFYASNRRQVFSEREFGLKDLRFFAEGAKTLSDLFTHEREELPVNYLNDKKLRAGYLLYFLPLNFCKMQSILQKLPPSFFNKPKLKVLDLGCGPGTATLALIDCLGQDDDEAKKHRCEISILALDQNYHVIKDSQFLHEEASKYLKAKGHSLKVSLVSRTFDLRRGKPDTLIKNDQYDLIVASNFLNEWSASRLDEKVKFLERICERHLLPDGYLILMEPALQRPTRELMELRDIFLERKTFHVFAPCLHQRGCPMLAATPRDWCHFYVPWEEPDFMCKLDRLLKNNNDFLKLSYMIFTPKAVSELNHLHLKKDRSHLYRTISNLMGSKGKSEIVLCGPAGRWHLTRLDKNESSLNKVFSKLKRGDLVFTPKIPERPFRNEGELKIEKEDVVEKQ
jgi:ribosomal protein RSM22 (predicted rRNA methylase)